MHFFSSTGIYYARLLLDVFYACTTAVYMQLFLLHGKSLTVLLAVAGYAYAVRVRVVR